jgi:hypothetical protein
MERNINYPKMVLKIADRRKAAAAATAAYT